MTYLDALPLPRSRRLLPMALLPVLGLLSAACGEEEGDETTLVPVDRGDWIEAPTGRLVGFLVNGQTGQPINLFGDDNLGPSPSPARAVWALIGGQLRRARPCSVETLGAMTADVADGCYQIPDVPADTDFPIFAEVEGFQRFQGQILYPLPDPNVPVRDQNPQIVGNIRLFPRGYGVDYRLRLSHLARPVSGARVVCQYQATSSNALGIDGSFIQPQNTTSGTIEATSDGEGVALLPRDALVVGARYACEVFVTAPVDERVLSGEVAFTAGVSASTLQLNLTAGPQPDGTFFAVHSNVDGSDVLQGADGLMRIVFNRPVEILPGTEDCQVATLSTSDTNGNGVTGSLPANTVGGGSESVLAEVSADGLTLTVRPRFATPLDPGDLGARVIFDGLVLRPRGGSRVVRYIGAIAGCTTATVYGTQAPLRNERTGGLQNNAVAYF